MTKNLNELDKKIENALVIEQFPDEGTLTTTKGGFMISKLLFIKDWAMNLDKKKKIIAAAIVIIIIIALVK